MKGMWLICIFHVWFNSLQYWYKIISNVDLSVSQLLKFYSCNFNVKWKYGLKSFNFYLNNKCFDKMQEEWLIFLNIFKSNWEQKCRELSPFKLPWMYISAYIYVNSSFYFRPLFPAVDEYIINFFLYTIYKYINLPSKISYMKGTNISRVYIKLHIMRSSLYCSVIKCKKCVSYKNYSYEDYHCQKTIVIVIVSQVCLI